jgi:hypothetical protein
MDLAANGAAGPGKEAAAMDSRLTPPSQAHGRAAKRGQRAAERGYFLPAGGAGALASPGPGVLSEGAK